MQNLLFSIKYKQRQKTTQICVVLQNLKKAHKDKLLREAYKRGDLDTGFHFILYNSGLFDVDREITAVAGYLLPESENSIYVLADTMNETKISDAQTAYLKELSRENGNIPIKFIEEV